MNDKWNKMKKELTDLYLNQGKSMAEIADMKEVSRERIRQVLKKLGIESKGHHVHTRQKKKYNSIETYFNNNHRHQDFDTTMLRSLLPAGTLFCHQCGNTKNLHFHHLVYPALSITDIEILCASCHHLYHKSLLTHQGILQLISDRIQGMSYKMLSTKYGIPVGTVVGLLYRMKKRLNLPFGKERYLGKGMSIKDASKALNIPYPTLQKRVQYNKMPCIRIAGMPIITFATIEELKKK